MSDTRECSCCGAPAVHEAPVARYASGPRKGLPKSDGPFYACEAHKHMIGLDLPSLAARYAERYAAEGAT